MSTGITWTPYALGRAFLGPVRWKVGGEEVTGSDRHHYALGAGSNVALGGGFDVFAEGAFLGERNVAAGASAAW